MNADELLLRFLVFRRTGRERQESEYYTSSDQREMNGAHMLEIFFRKVS
jgi:hypothetical protein